MILEVLNHSFHYEMENLCRAFYPNEKIKTLRSLAVSNEETIITTTIHAKDCGADMEVRIRCSADNYDAHRIISVSSDIAGFAEECERSLAVALFELLRERTGYTPSWGILTGVRPSKLMTTLLKSQAPQQALEYFTGRLLVSPQKANLALSVAKIEEAMIQKADPDAFSLYVSIPFCPSRCSYCSFVSHSIQTASAKKLLPAYMDLLCEELRRIGVIASALRLRLQTVYIGGGTPTVLEPPMLERLLEAIDKHFDIAGAEEYTVEAGRPDTITPEKMHLLKRYGADRISINPQSFNQTVLGNIGREHTVESILDAYSLATQAGFKCINMDLIAGLPGESLESFTHSLSKASAMNPQNITVHTLAMKRASELSAKNTPIEDGDLVAEMLSAATDILQANGYAPYYMYRQSKSAGNLENVGWSQAGFECLYNVYMMEECQTVLSAGAGAVTKLKKPGTNHIERIFNFKYPYEYTARFEELMDRKKRISAFYTEEEK